jgi:MraZ protein
MIIGQYQAKLTEKERISLPAKFRREIGNKLIIAKWYEGCLVLVSQEKWDELLNKLTGKSEIISKPIRNTDRFILGSGFEVKVDLHGRFVIPKILKEYAHLTKEVVFVGLGDRVEVWDKGNWRKVEKEVQAKASEMIEKIANERSKSNA